MNLPFTVEQFLEVFANYNNAVWPLQVVLNLLAIIVVYLAVKRSSYTDKVVPFVLSFLWIWMGWVYHITFFRVINPAALGFGATFIFQGLLFLTTAWKGQVSFQATWGGRQSIGSLLIAYGLVMYPLLGYGLGHVFPSAPTFGAPCPTTIFTFGVLLWSTGLPKYLLIIPSLWSVVGFTAALTLGITEDVGLLVAGVVANTTILVAKPQMSASPVS